MLYLRRFYHEIGSLLCLWNLKHNHNRTVWVKKARAYLRWQKSAIGFVVYTLNKLPKIVSKIEIAWWWCTVFLWIYAPLCNLLELTLMLRITLWRLFVKAVDPFWKFSFFHFDDEIILFHGLTYGKLSAHCPNLLVNSFCEKLCVLVWPDLPDFRIASCDGFFFFRSKSATTIINGAHIFNIIYK